MLCYSSTGRAVNSSICSATLAVSLRFHDVLRYAYSVTMAPSQPICYGRKVITEAVAVGRLPFSCRCHYSGDTSLRQRTHLTNG